MRVPVHARPPIVRDEAVEYVKADLTAIDDCRRVVEGMDYVFMCAGNSSGAAVMTATPLLHMTPHVVMIAQLIQAAYDAKVKKYLFMSSTAAYPPTGERPVREDEMFVGDPYDSHYAVGWTKRYGEILCKLFAQRLKEPMPTVVIRPSNVYGPHDDFEFASSHVVPALIRRVIERHHPVEVWGTGDDVRDLIYIDDLIDGMITVFEKTESYSATNIALGKGYSIKEVLETIIDIDCYKDATLRFDPSKPSTIPVRMIDTARAKREFGFQARTSLREGIAKTIAWYRHFSTAAKAD